VNLNKTKTFALDDKRIDYYEFAKAWQHSTTKSEMCQRLGVADTKRNHARLSSRASRLRKKWNIPLKNFDSRSGKSSLTKEYANDLKNFVVGLTTGQV